MQNVIQAIPATGFNTASIVGVSFYPINTGGLPESCFYMSLMNYSDINLFFSFDAGVTIHGAVNAGQPWPGGMFSVDKQLGWEKGLTVHVRNAAVAGGAGTGLVYLFGYYR